MATQAQFLGAPPAYAISHVESYRNTLHPHTRHSHMLHTTNPPFQPTLPIQSSSHTAHVYRHHSQQSYMTFGPQPPIQQYQTQPQHGTKRSAPDDEIEKSANISTHFKKLRLKDARLPHPSTISPVGVSLRTSLPPLPPGQVHHSHHAASTKSWRDHDQKRRPQQHGVNLLPPQPDSEFMSLDETPNRIFIHDLDGEISAIEAEEAASSRSNPSSNSTTTFHIPSDLDKSISKVPHNILRNDFDRMASTPPPPRDNSQALILYRDPSSISVPPEEDAVRKAIIASRREAREKMRRDNEKQMQSTGQGITQVTPDLGESRGAGNDGDMKMNDEIDFNNNNDEDDAMDLE